MGPDDPGSHSRATTLSESFDTNPPSALSPPASDGRRVFGNFVSLSIVQFANYLAPVITLPYLFRVLGLEKYGLTELARAISVYFLMLTDYGFSLSATQEISVHRDDPGKVSEVFSAVLLLKSLLLVLSLALLSLLVLVVPRLRADWPVYYLSFGNVVGMWLFPIWLFQGLERMKYIPLLSVTAKMLYVLAILGLIHGPADYLYAPLLQSASAILIGLAGLILALWKFRVRFRMVSAAVLKREFVNGWHLFLSKTAITFYTATNVVILGLFTDNTFVAYYAAGDKIIRALTDGLHIPLSQAIFPHIGRLAFQSQPAALRFAARVARLLSLATLTISAGTFVAAPWIARIVLGPNADGSVPVIRILSLLPFIVGLSNIFGTQIMVNFGLKKLLARILAAAGLLNIVLALLFVMSLQHVGIALASLATEIFVTTVMFVALRKRGLNVFGRADPAVDKQRGVA
jgi:PST family polysaccharide transporter